MKSIRLFTHVACEPPGYLVTLLDRLGYSYEQVCLYDGQTVPVDLDKVSALVFMGGPGNVNEPADWMQQEMALIRQADAMGVPVLGICLGAQLMSKALGGQVWQSDEVEVGWHDIQRLALDKPPPFLEKLPQQFCVFQWHAHSFSPPPGAQSIATSRCTECQAYVHGKNLALQFHLEMTEDIIMSLIEKYADDLQPVSGCVQGADEILTDISSRCDQVFTIADCLLTRWFHTVYPGNFRQGV